RQRRGRRNAVIRLAIPGGKIQNLDVGLGKSQRFLKRTGPLPIRRDVNKDSRLPFPRMREFIDNVRCDTSIKPIGHMAQRNGLPGLKPCEYLFESGKKEIYHRKGYNAYIPFKQGVSF